MEGRIRKEDKLNSIESPEIAQATEFIKQKENNVENINLVTPTSYIPQIIEAIKKIAEIVIP